MKNVVNELFEGTTDPGSVFYKIPTKTVQEEEITDVYEAVPSMNSIIEEFNSCGVADRVAFLRFLVVHDETRNNLITIMLSDPKASQVIKNQLNDFSSQHSR